MPICPQQVSMANHMQSKNDSVDSAHEFSKVNSL